MPTSRLATAIVALAAVSIAATAHGAVQAVRVVVDEDAIGYDEVEVDVEVHQPAKPLHEGDRAGARRGEAALARDVAFVDPAGTDNTMCTLSMPCTEVAKALATNRPFVKFKGTTDEAVTISGGRKVTFLAEPNATLTRSTGNGAIATIQDDGTEVTVFDLSISNAPNNPSGIGVVVPAASGAPKVTLVRTKLTNNPGGGISSSGGTLTVSQSTIANNTGGISSSGGTLTVSQSTIANNTGGGISVNGGTFVVVGNVFFNNGTQLGNTGGVNISTVQSATRRIGSSSTASTRTRRRWGSVPPFTASRGRSRRATTS